MAEVIATSMSEVEAPAFRGRRMVLGWTLVAAVGFVALAIGLLVDPARTWLSYLFAYGFAFTTVCGGLILLMISYAANARWMSVVRRPMEAVVLPMPALAVLVIPLFFGLSIYPWHTPPADLSEPARAVLHHRASYLNTTFVIVRAVIYFAILITASFLLRRWSLRRDQQPSVVTDDPQAALGRERAFASGMLPPVGLAFTFAVMDWLMSLQWLWSSTMFPVIMFGSGFLAAIAVVTVLTDRMWTHGTPGVTQHHFHALGRMLFAFVVFWGYAAFFQAMLIRIANKPDEVVFYLHRMSGTWGVLAWILIVGHFALPFAILMPRSIKFRPRAMAISAGWLLAMHLVHMYWIVIPARVPGGMVFHWLDLGALAAVGGTCMALAAWRQHGVSNIAERDPFLPDGVRYRSPL